MSSVKIWSPKQAAAFGRWVNTDENISPASISVHEVAIKLDDSTLTDSDRQWMSEGYISAIYVNQGDESIIIDNEGNLWEHTGEDYKIEQLPPEPKEWTVIGVYTEHDGGGYMSSVTADTPEEALEEAQRQCKDDNGMEEDDEDMLTDLAVCEGDIRVVL